MNDDIINVLIIDDTPINLALLHDVLEVNGCKVFVAQDGRKGAELAKNRQPDIVLLDVMMPDFDGFETCRLLQSDEHTKDIPVIFLSALSDMESTLKGFRAGAVDYVTKPLRQEEVLARIQVQVELKRSRERIRELERRNTVLAMAVTTAHEITQPLTILKGALDLLSMEIEVHDISRAMEYVDRCRTAAARIERLMEKYRSDVGVGIGEYGGGSSMVLFPEKSD
ncbi:response regulator [Sediminispirochaeta smaragdinae]|jgi:DNA-binding response OmpR family regulator|uniref:histidine kinase n=1 Tax=Sediminispirochaeta smaragdinae (strain DSM 11293 / JCM 15392 / SEBR 4228) TaxID=573413 RepID=E1R9A5_SEDSS|nr:response regulator [Sediminispirochaeta smaragdinae]ADK83074.1 response regulator receiver protein [Sediminispirochaeta smaragdinae DSM 11293]